MAVPHAQPTSPPLASASHTTTTSHSQGQGNTFATTAGDSTTALDSRIDESDLDPAAFLKSVRELSEKREREDSERVRRLEEEIEQGRQERARRRQERARSISPEKVDASERRPLSSRHDSRSIASPPPLTPPASSSSATMEGDSGEGVPEFKGFGSGGKSNSSMPSTQTQSASSLARSGTLSWQRRPASRGANSRPQSITSGDKGQTSISYREEPEKSRDQIAAELGSRDPSWFKQTADRGIGNAAFRKSKDEARSDSVGSGRRALPGMSREASVNVSREGSPAPSDVRSDATSRPSSARDSTFSTARFSNTRTSTSSKPDLKSLIAADEGQEKASPMSDKTSTEGDGEQLGPSRTLTMSSSQARIANSQDRPPSPTKGMGGFVSSAMMKRADSQTKRWSAQPGGSLSRQNSLASARSGYGGLQGSHSMPKLEPTPDSREASNEPSSRPTSSSSNMTTQTATQSRDEKDTFVKPSLPREHSRSKSVASNYNTSADDGHTTSPPSSPSKRWSPTKSSWLESSITKPESSKPVPARNSQPDWMANIAKAKAQRASVDITPKPADDAGSRSASPTKATFGQGMLKRSESGGLGTPRTTTPKPADADTSRAASPAKRMFEQSALQRSDSRDLKPESGRSTPVTKPTPPEPVEKLQAATFNKSPEPQQSPEKPADTKSATDVKSPPPPEEPKGKESTPVKSPPPANKPKPETVSKPEAASKPQTDFRSTLRSRPPPQAKQSEQPEFLARFGNLKKAETKNYVAPDTLKDNILRGKGDLTKTDGPVKTQRRDELRESLLAKKEQWKKEKDEGIVHERKTSNPPLTPQKPEALARREMMGRTGSMKQGESPDKTATPEALARHKSLKSSESIPPVTKQKSEPAVKPTETKTELPHKQTSTPVSATASKPATETSKLASRFNPGLASMLARGPPAQTSNSNGPSRSESPSVPQRTETPPEPPADGAALQDMRKGRAKGPKKRGKGGAQAAEPEPTTAEPTPVEAEPKSVTSPPPQEAVPEPQTAEVAPTKAKPRAPPGSAASIMMASLQKSPRTEMEKPATPLKGQAAISPEPSKPATPAKSPSLSSKTSLDEKTEGSSPTSSTSKPTLFGSRAMQPKPSTPAKSSAVQSAAPTVEQKPAETPQSEVPDFKGFGSMKRSNPEKKSSTIHVVDDNKENVAEGSPSVKSAASKWGRQLSPRRTETPVQIQLPSAKDEEAAMRSAGLLASSPSRPGSRDGLGIALEQGKGTAQMPPALSGAPPKPLKSSRSVSGQLTEASGNKGPSDSLDQPKNATEQQLHDTFGCIPRSNDRLTIDTGSVIANEPQQERVFKTLRKTVQLISPEGVLRPLPQHQEYVFFDESVYIFTHAYSIANGPKKAEVFLWVGSGSSQTAVDQAQAAAKKIAKTEGNAYIATVRQGFEPRGFLQALGGILLTRRGSAEGATKQFMLCGRQHLGQIVFDEVDFGITSLCSGFAFLISYPTTLQETKLYLWKGAAASPEEISAARLAAMDLSETGEIIEVDDRVEFSSFMKIFGPGTTKASIPPSSDFWQAKAAAPSRFHTRLFRLQKAEQKTGGAAGMFGSFFTRRPSWHSAAKSPGANDEVGMKVEVKEVSPFTQSDFEAEGLYILDAYAHVYVLVGPVFPSQPEGVRNSLLAQGLLFATEYATLAASTEDRLQVPGMSVVLAGIHGEARRLFRFWDEGLGFWGTGGLMAGSAPGRDGEVVLNGESVSVAVCANMA